MNQKLIKQGKKILSKFLPDSMRLRLFSYIPRLERFRKAHTEKYPTFPDKHEMYDYINDVVIKNRAILYLEFGVFEGASIKYWASLNSNIKSRFCGFDTFTGLPEKYECFAVSLDKKTFDVFGRYPQVDDERVSFIKGMFQDTLPKFLENYNYSQPLIIHNDADLYSSTLYMLTYANSIIVPGTIIIFDEFSSMLNEFRALEDYCVSYMREYEVVGATISSSLYYDQVAIRIK
ncbi:TylF/MycF/NovP-related O-methyltransferase [Candidatus Omnitrophota bacterium]